MRKNLVGMATETELEDFKLWIEDAKNATFAAIEESIVPGVGAAYVHLSAYVPAIKNKIEDNDENLVPMLCKKHWWHCSLDSAHCRSRGKEEVVREKTKDRDWEICYNAIIDKHENLVRSGVSDPAKVIIYMPCRALFQWLDLS